MNYFEKILNKLSKRKRMPKVCRGLQVFAIVLFSLFILSLALIMGTTEKGLKIMTRRFVDNVEVDEKYFEHLMDYGFDEDMCRELLEGDEIRHLTADILTDRLRAVFKNTKSYELSFDESKELVKGYVKGVADNHSLKLEDKELNILTSYTCDISGISTMFLYDTPAKYRTAVFDVDKADIEAGNSLLQLLAFLTSPVFVVMNIVMYFIIIILLLVLGNKISLTMPIANTSLYPSIAILGFSFGEVFMMNANAVTDYIFRLLMISSGTGIIFGILLFFAVRFITSEQ